MNFSNVNKTIGDQMRFIQNFQANPKDTSAASSGSAAMNAQMQQIMPMMLMMMFQMMMRLMPGMGQPPSQDPFAGLPNTLPPNAHLTPNCLPEQQRIQQNPAYQFVSTQLNGDNTTTANTIAMPDFSDTNSLINQINTLTAGLTDPNLQNLASQLTTLPIDSPQSAQLKTQAETALKNKGASDADIARFDLLFQGLQANNSTGQIVNQLQALTANLNPPSPEIQQLQSQLSQVSQLLTQSQAQMAQQWQNLQPTGTTTDPGVTNPTLVTQVQTALANHQFTPQDLGQSLKYLLNNAPAGSLNQLSGLMSSLMKSGTLNIDPFLQSGYLDMLSPERKDAVMGAVQTAGLTLDNGEPNARFAGFILESLAKPGPSSTRDFLQQFLQWDAANYQNSHTPEGQALAHLLPLAGLNYSPPAGL